MTHLFSAAFAPIGTLWRMAEAHSWISIGALGAIALGTWLIGQPMWTLVPVFLLSVLLMRTDAVKAPPAP